jgi:probable HAF family extracellular repeat protein
MAVASGSVWAQGTFTGMGAPNTYLSGISADGTIAVGVYGTLGPAWRWTATTGVVNIGSVSQQAKISRDGKTIVGDAKDSSGIVSASIWQSGTTWRNLGGVPNGKVLDGQLSSAWGVSADGSAIAGLAWVNPTGAHGFRWSGTTGMVDLGSLQAESSRASAISGDGNVVAGWDENPRQDSQYNYWRGAIWWQGMERLMNPFGWIGQVEGANDVGSVLVGRGSPMAPTHAFRFTAWDGRAVDMGALPRSSGGGIGPGLGPGPNGQGAGPGPAPTQGQDPEDRSIAFAVSDDGDTAVGSSGYVPPTDAFIWTSATGMVKVSDYLASKGITGFERWTLVVANSVSPNGKIIAGTGINPMGFAEGWIATLP